MSKLEGVGHGDEKENGDWILCQWALKGWKRSSGWPPI